MWSAVALWTFVAIVAALVASPYVLRRSARLRALRGTGSRRDALPPSVDAEPLEGPTREVLARLHAAEVRLRGVEAEAGAPMLRGLIGLAMLPAVLAGGETSLMRFWLAKETRAAFDDCTAAITVWQRAVELEVSRVPELADTLGSARTRWETQSRDLGRGASSRGPGPRMLQLLAEDVAAVANAVEVHLHTLASKREKARYRGGS